MDNLNMPSWDDLLEMNNNHDPSEESLREVERIAERKMRVEEAREKTARPDSELSIKELESKYGQVDDDAGGKPYDPHAKKQPQRHFVSRYTGEFVYLPNEDEAEDLISQGVIMEV